VHQAAVLAAGRLAVLAAWRAPTLRRTTVSWSFAPLVLPAERELPLLRAPPALCSTMSWRWLGELGHTKPAKHHSKRRRPATMDTTLVNGTLVGVKLHTGHTTRCTERERKIAKMASLAAVCKSCNLCRKLLTYKTKVKRSG